MSLFMNNGYISENLLMIDAHGWRNKKTTSSFILKSEYIAIFDPGGNNSSDIVINALKEYGFNLSSIKYLFVSHRHNDHSGGASVLVKKLKNAKIYAHPITIENLKNPEKINEATKAMYGFLGEPIDPVKDVEKLVKINDGDTFDIGNGLKIRAMLMPGHTSDHFMFYEEKNGFVFTGDGAGLFSGKYMKSLPNSFPPSFKFEEYRRSLLKLIDLKPKIIGFSHFGAISGDDVPIVLKDALQILDEWKEIIENNENYENVIFNKYKDQFDLFSEDFRNDVLKIIINGFKKNL